MRPAHAVLVLLVIGLAAGGLIGYGLLWHPSLAPYAALAMQPPPRSDGGLRARFFGVTTVQVDDGKTAILTDGFFSRPGLMQLLLGKIAPDPARIDAALQRGNVSKLAAVLVAHSHYDHALDATVVAGRTGALLVGSASTANIGRGQGLAEDRIRIVRQGDVLTFGRFTIEVFESPHAPRMLFPGEISEPLRPPAGISAYREGGNYAFLLRHDRGTILIQPSANFVPGLFRNVQADVVFLGIGGLGRQTAEFAHGYWREVVQTTGAKLVIPIHWDDFTRPLDEPLRPMPPLMDDFDAGMRILVRLAGADKVTIGLPKAFEMIDLSAPGP